MTTPPPLSDLPDAPGMDVLSPWDADPGALRALGHRLIDEAVDWVTSHRERPVWQAPPESARAAFAGPFPEDGADPEALHETLRTHLMPHVLGTAHPRWWGYVAGGGSLMGAYGAFLANLLASPALGGNQASTDMELQVLRWMGDLVGFPADAEGVLTTGAPRPPCWPCVPR